MGYAVETRCLASHHASHHASHYGIDDTYSVYNVYDWETRSIASLRNTRQNINLQKVKETTINHYSQSCSSYNSVNPDSDNFAPCLPVACCLLPSSLFPAKYLYKRSIESSFCSGIGITTA
ncbi:MAG: hypothetical protein LBL13_06505 [Bacteroidales bacterium]|nr:hypothetical protein [Bacteroidales bacterium]